MASKKQTLRKVVFDIETTAGVEPGQNITDMTISIVGAYDSKTDKYATYTVEELPKLWTIIEQSDMLVGYNSDHFDIPLLNKYYPGDLTKIKSLDLLVEIKGALGRRLRLDTIAEATLGTNKSGHGLQAVQWWKDGKEDLVRKYCEDDVRITKELYDYALKNGKLKYKDFGETRTIKLDTSDWETLEEQAALTHTLPF